MHTNCAYLFSWVEFMLNKHNVCYVMEVSSGFESD